MDHQYQEPERDPATMRRSPSSGGLLMAKRMADEPGGKIWVESEGAGKGSTFWFRFPLKQPVSAEKD
jgi:signal transduction histidine kinase